jgi:hypothetical protein
VDQSTLTGWLQQAAMDRKAQKRIYPMCLRGNRSVDFDNDLAVEWAVRWLTEHNVKVWIIDPLSKLYRDDEQSNREFNRWWLRAEDIAARAGVRVVVLVHHTGHDETTADRARGASAMMGNPDVLITYRHSGQHGALPPNDKRYLAAFGRNVALPEFEIDFDAATNELFATGSGMNHKDAHRRQRAIDVWEYLLAKQPNSVPKTTLLDDVGLPSRGKGTNESNAILDYATQQRWVVMTPSGAAKLYAMGPASPPMAERSPTSLSRRAGDHQTGEREQKCPLSCGFVFFTSFHRTWGNSFTSPYIGRIPVGGVKFRGGGPFGGGGHGGGGGHR